MAATINSSSDDRIIFPDEFEKVFLIVMQNNFLFLNKSIKKKFLSTLIIQLLIFAK